MEGEKPCVLGEQNGVRAAGSGPGDSCRAAAPAEGWDGGFAAAAQNNLLVWAEHQCWAVLGHLASVRCHYLCPRGFEKGVGSLWRAVVAVELEGRTPPSSNYPAISSAHEVLHTRKINRCC